MEKVLFVHGIPTDISNGQVERVLRACPGFLDWKDVRLPDSVVERRNLKVYGFVRFADLWSVRQAKAILNVPGLISSNLSISDQAEETENGDMDAQEVQKIQQMVHDWAQHQTGMGDAKRQPDPSSESTVRLLSKLLERDFLDEECKVFRLSKQEERDMVRRVQAFRQSARETEQKIMAIRQRFLEERLKDKIERGGQALESASGGRLSPSVETEQDMSEYDQFERAVARDGSAEQLYQQLFKRLKPDIQDEKAALAAQAAYERERELEQQRYDTFCARRDAAKARVAQEDEQLALHPDRTDILKRYQYYASPVMWRKARQHEVYRDSQDRRKELASSSQSEPGESQPMVSESQLQVPEPQPAVQEPQPTVSGPQPAVPEPQPTSIPDIADTDKLFNWPIRWENYNEKVLEALRPVIVANLVEFLGMEDEDLVGFIVGHLNGHKSASSLVSELEMALDEDAPKLVAHVWQQLITATEETN